MSLDVDIRRDDPASPEARALVERHLADMHRHSPACSVHALGVERLKEGGVMFWTAWRDGEIAGMGALKPLDVRSGEIKSMRVADAFLGKGVGRAILKRIIDEARALRLEALYLETGSSPAFIPALKLYESEGFSYCGPFAEYRDDPFSRFMVRAI